MAAPPGFLDSTSMASAPFPGSAFPRVARGCLPAAVLALALTLTYWNSLSVPFLFDDTGAVVHNPTIRRLCSFDVFQPPADGSTTTGRPLVNLSFALNYALSGDQAWSYHAGNLAIHALAALTLMGVVRRTLAGPRLRPRFGTHASTIGFFTALLWALHPLQTESVTCIAQRTESLCGLFYLLTLYAFARSAFCHPLDDKTDAPDGGAPGVCHLMEDISTRRRRRAWQAASVATCLAGMASKEVMVTAPLVMLLYDRTFVAGGFTAALSRRRGYYAALAATWGLLAWLVASGRGTRGVAAGFDLGVTGWSYLLKQCEALLHYLRLSLWPHPLVLDYGSSVVASPLEVWWQGLAVLAALAVTGWALWRRPVAGFLGAWFFLLLAPSSSFVPLVTQTMAEHRMYLPLAAVVVAAVALALRGLAQSARWLLGAVALVFAASTLARNHDYRDAVTIWSTSVAAYPASARTHNNLGQALQEAGRPAESNAAFARAVALEPRYASARYNWGVALLAQDRAAEAITQLEAAVQLAPDHADAHLNLGTALSRTQRPGEAVRHFERALQLQPAADAHFNLGVALADLGRPAAAAVQLRAALQINPGLAEALYHLGRLAEQGERPAEAAVHFRAVLRHSPDHLGAHRRLGLLLARSDDYAAAATHFRAILRLQPTDADTLANLGNVLLLQGQAREAIARYEEALRLRPEDPRTQENLRLARESLR